MSLFTSIPHKRSDQVDLVKPLKNLITSLYATSEESVNFDDAIDSLNKLRIQCTNKNLDYKHEGTIDLLQRYYDQITSLEAKIPVSELQIPFKWKNSFIAGSSWLSSSSSSLTVPSLSYERVCILYNIAASMSQVASAQINEGLTNDSALKLSAKYFSTASGIFQGLKHLTPTALGNNGVTEDLKTDSLQVLHLLTLAQAQESFFFKASNDNMKDGVIARIANQVEDYYAETFKYVSAKYIWPDEDWPRIIKMKQLAFKAIAEYYQSLVNGSKSEYGEQLARLAVAIESFKLAESTGTHIYPAVYREYSLKANRIYGEVKKDNDFIYHARVPEAKSLADMGKAVIAKPTAIPVRFKPDQPDLFERLLPVATQQAVSKLESQKQEAVNMEIAQLREATQVLNGVLVSLNLPAAIEDSSKGQLPPSIKEKAAAIKARGGMQEVDKFLNELPDLFQRNREILDETDRILMAEEESDNKLREQFKERWTRTPSTKLNTFWKDNISKYRTIIQNAMEADNKVRIKVKQHRDKIQLLSSGEGDIAKAIPSSSGSVNFDSSFVRKLRDLMNQVEAIKNEREVIESELKSTPFTDMKIKFLSALANDGAINEAALLAESIGEIYGPLRKQVRESKARQDQLVIEIQKAHEEFARSNTGSSGTSSRDAFLSELAAAHDAYFEVLANLSEGTKFYNDLTQLLVNLQNKVDDFCFARKAEREELCKDMQLAITSQANPPPPAAPAYHQPGHNEPPPRPPPPANAPQPSYPTQPPQAPNPYAGAPAGYVPQQVYYAPPPLPPGYNPYAGAPQPYQHPTVPGYPYPQQPQYTQQQQPQYTQQQQYPTYPGYPQQPPPRF